MTDQENISQADVSKFLAQNMAEHLLFPLLERQKKHLSNLYKTIGGGAVGTVGSIIYGLTIPYGSSVTGHLWIGFISFLVAFCSIPVLFYCYSQKKHFENLITVMSQIILKNS